MLSRKTLAEKVDTTSNRSLMSERLSRVSSKNNTITASEKSRFSVKSKISENIKMKK